MRPSSLPPRAPKKPEAAGIWFMLTYLIGAGALAWLFRRALGRWLVKKLPDRTTRHAVVSAIIIAFVVTFMVRLAARFM